MRDVDHLERSNKPHHHEQFAHNRFVQQTESAKSVPLLFVPEIQASG